MLHLGPCRERRESLETGDIREGDVCFVVVVPSYVRLTELNGLDRTLSATTLNPVSCHEGRYEFQFGMRQCHPHASCEECGNVAVLHWCLD